MEKIKVLIVDDEPIAREILEGYIGKIDFLEMAGTCQNAIEAFAAISKQQVDLVMLDINMPEMSGIDLLRSLQNPPLVIFTTAYPQYAVESYELQALDYLLKPIAFPRFMLAIHKAKELLRSTTSPENTALASDPLLFVRSEGKWVNINLNNLWLVEGLKDYVRLWIADERITVHSTMKKMEEQLSAYPYFVRIHKSHLVNLNYVTEVDGNSLRVKTQQLAIGSTFKDDVQQRIEKYKLL